MDWQQQHARELSFHWNCYLQAGGKDLTKGPCDTCGGVNVSCCYCARIRWERSITWEKFEAMRNKY